MIDDLREQNLKVHQCCFLAVIQAPSPTPSAWDCALLVFIGPDSIFACVKVLPKAIKHPVIYNRVNDGNAGMNGCKLQQRSTRAAQACSENALFACDRSGMQCLGPPLAQMPAFPITAIRLVLDIQV